MQLVSLQVKSATQTGKVPTSVVLTFGYYQMDDVRKKLVTSTIQFSGFISPTEVPAAVYNYTLKVNYLPLSHTDLMIAFSLPWYVYFTMYIIVGLLAVVMTGIFVAYHILLARRKNTSFSLLGYLKFYLPSPLKGFLLVTVPLGLYIVTVGVFFTFHLMQVQVSNLWCSSKDPACLKSNVWNKVTAYPHATTDEKRVMSYTRLGFIFIHAGLWIMWRNSKLMTLQPTKSEASGIFVGYDKNCWYATAWQRMNYFAFNLLVVVIEVFFVHASFSDLFSNNLWYFIAAFKVVGIVAENASEVLLANNLMLSPISVTIDMMENLVTFGASDFLQFISSYVLGFGVQMAERAYVEPFIDYIVDAILDNRQKILAYFSNILGEPKVEDENEEGPEERDGEDGQDLEPESPGALKDKEKPEEREAAENKDQLSHKDSQGSDILLTENSAENDAGDFFNQLNPRLLGEANEEESEEDEQSFLIDAKNSKIPIRDRVNKVLAEVMKKIHHNPYSQQDDEFEHLFKQREQELEKAKGSKKAELKKEEEKEEGKEAEVDSDANIETYYNYCVRTISMLFFPLSVVIIWQFYTETAFSAKWSIKQKDFLFYFLFAIMIIPFTIVIDVLFYNLMAYLYGYDYLGSLKKWNAGSRFSLDCSSARKTNFWMGFRPQKLSLDPKLRPLDQFGFSSQFYFMALLGVGANVFLIIGLMIILEMATNPYLDIMLFVLLCVNQVIMVIIEWLCTFLRRKLRIWEAQVDKVAGRLSSPVSPLVKKSSLRSRTSDKSDQSLPEAREGNE